MRRPHFGQRCQQFRAGIFGRHGRSLTVGNPPGRWSVPGSTCRNSRSLMKSFYRYLPRLTTGRGAAESGIRWWERAGLGTGVRRDLGGRAEGRGKAIMKSLAVPIATLNVAILGNGTKPEV